MIFTKYTITIFYSIIYNLEMCIISGIIFANDYSNKL